jgi:hypothetical protein
MLRDVEMLEMTLGILICSCLDFVHSTSYLDRVIEGKTTTAGSDHSAATIILLVFRCSGML